MPLRFSKCALEGESLTTAGMWALQFAGSFLGALRPFNIVVTNVPGPAATLDLLGCRLAEAYPQVPLFSGQALGVALFSYADKLCWGFNADYDLVPDLPQVPGLFAESFDELSRSAELLDVARTGASERQHMGEPRVNGMRGSRVHGIADLGGEASVSRPRVPA